MLKNIERTEVDAFEQAMEYRITNLKNRCREIPDDSFPEGQQSAFEYALAIYRECRKDGTI